MGNVGGGLGGSGAIVVVVARGVRVYEVGRRFWYSCFGLMSCLVV